MNYEKKIVNPSFGVNQITKNTQSIIDEDITVGMIAKTDLLYCAPDTCIADAAMRMREISCSSVIVKSGDSPVGIWTERDALSIDLSRDTVLDEPISKVMNSPIKTINASASLSQAGTEFRRLGVRHFLVLDDDENLMGMVSQSDVILNQSVEHFLDLRQVGSALRQPLVLVRGEDSLQSVVNRMRQHRVDAAVVEENENLEAGIITERDIVKLIGERRTNNTATEVASRPLVSIPATAALVQARDLLAARQIRHVGITGREGAILGLLSFSDILESIQYTYVDKLETTVKERDEALSRSEENLKLAHSVIDVAPEAIAIVDSSVNFEAVNPAFTELTGYQPHEVIGQNPRVLSSGRHDKKFYKNMWSSLNSTGFWQGEIWNRKKTGEVYPEWLSINVIREGKGDISRYAAIFTDITERKEKEERIKNLAYFDVLTGLPNRSLFMDRLEQAMVSIHRQEQQQYIGLLVLDLDMFKRINDTLGHASGDRVLESMAQRLKLLVRDSDTVSRLSGDEFAILLPGLHRSEEALNMAQRIVEEVNIPLNIDGRELFVTGSVGLSIFPGDGENADTMLKNAFAANHRAKEVGRNCYQLYASTLNAHAVERLTMETSLRHAIERDELRLNYQVKVNMETGAMSGAEALIRWHHPEMGMVSPVDFIPLAEETGLIVPIGDWVLQTACKQIKAWQDRGLTVPHVAVNVSAVQFDRGGFVEKVREALNETNIDPKHLIIELTESALMEKMDKVVAALHELREMGVHIAIDDFGTGYSSLSYLKRMPIDCLKIDQSFVGDMSKSKDDTAIVLAIVAMAKALSLRIVAEGVETIQQMKFLNGLGCEEIQGYLVGRPVTSENLESLFEADLLAFASE